MDNSYSILLLYKLYSGEHKNEQKVYELTRFSLESNIYKPGSFLNHLLTMEDNRRVLLLVFLCLISTSILCSACPENCTCIVQETFGIIQCSNGIYNSTELGLWLHSLNTSEIRFYNSSLKKIPPEICEMTSKTGLKIDLKLNDITELKDKPDCVNRIVSLKIEYNKLRKIGFEFFRNFTELVTLILSHNQLDDLHPRTFLLEDLKKLVKIDISHNRLQTVDMWIFQIPSYVEAMKRRDNSYRGHVNTSFNQIFDVENTIGFSLYNITRGPRILIDLSYNNIHSALDWVLAVGLDMKHPLTQALVLIYHSWDVTMIFFHNKFYCDCDMYKILKDAQPILRFFNQTTAESLIEIPCYKPQNLAGKLIIKVPLNDFQCGVASCTEENCKCTYTPNIERIQIQCNHGTLQHLPQIKPKATIIELDVSGNRIKDININKMYLSNVTSLDISRNEIVSISPGFLFHLKNVESLILSKNKITHFPEEIKSWKTGKLKELRLSQNPLACDCHTKWIKQWLVDLSKELNLDLQEITCQTPSWNMGKLVKDIPDSDFVCWKINWIQIVVPTASAITSIVIVSAVVVALRRYIALYLFIKFGWRFSYDYSDENRLYDVFFAFNSEDQTLVEEITEKLENNDPAYRVCLHFKEFEPGVPVAMNIVRYMQASHCTVMVVSKNFLKSDWCKYEFRMAHYDAIKEKHNRVIVVLIEDITGEDIEDDLKVYMKTNTYLKHDDAKFWPRFLMSLPKPSGRSNPLNEGNIQEYNESTALLWNR